MYEKKQKGLSTTKESGVEQNKAGSKESVAKKGIQTRTLRSLSRARPGSGGSGLTVSSAESRYQQLAGQDFQE